MVKIVFITYKEKAKSFELYLMANCPRNLEGDFINDPADLDMCEKYLHEAVEILRSNNTYKYSNPVKVIREEKCVYIQSAGIKTGITEKICGYKISDSLIMNK